MRIFGRHYDHKQGKQPSRRAPDAYELYEREHRVHTPVKDPMEEDHQSEKVRRKPQRCNKIDYKAEEFIALKKLQLSKDDQDYSYKNRPTTNMMSHPLWHQSLEPVTHGFTRYDHTLDKHTHGYAGYFQDFDNIAHSHANYYDHNMQEFMGGEATDFSTQYHSSLYDTGLNRRNDYYPEHIRNHHGLHASPRAACHKIIRFF